MVVYPPRGSKLDRGGGGGGGDGVCMYVCMFVLQAALREDPPLLLLVGNKSDKMEERCVAMEDGGKMALV